ncbi:MAG: hypothetical protein K0S62_2993 [Kosakonia cowanii]|nr:hypothetical protein [Kosakonia cowanii]
MRGDLPSGRWGLHGGIGGMFPFTGGWGVSFISCAVNGIRGAAALPLSIPAAPRGNRCCALRSPPAFLTAAGSTRLTRPFRDSSMSRFASVRHPWRPDLVIHASVRRFQRGHNPIAFILQIKAKTVSLELRFCRPDKAGMAVIMPDGA